MSVQPSTVKGKIRNLVRRLGIELIYFEDKPSSTVRYPFGDMGTILQDLHARGLECSTILDIGANKGGWSLEALAVFSQAKVVMIEPLREMQEFLEAICQQHDGSAYFIEGAGPNNGVMDLTVGKDSAGSTFLGAFEKKGGKAREVPVRSIDSILTSENIPPPELVKIDVQGYELEVLKGAENLFGHVEVFIIEVSFFPSGVSSRPIFSEVLSFMEGKGYALYDFAGFLRRPLDGALAQADPVFVKKDGIFRDKLGWDV